MGLIFAGAEVFIQGWPPHMGFFIGAILPLVFGGLIFADFLRKNPVVDA